MKEPQRTVGGLFKKCTLSADILLLLLKYPLYFFKMTRLSNNSTRNCLLLSQISSKDCRLVPCMSDCHPCSDCWPDCCVCASSGWDLTGVSLWSPAGWWLPLELLFSDGSLHRPPPRTKYQQSVHNTHQYNQPVRRQCSVLTELRWKVTYFYDLWKFPDWQLPLPGTKLTQFWRNLIPWCLLCFVVIFYLVLLCRMLTCIYKSLKSLLLLARILSQYLSVFSTLVNTDGPG